MSLRETRKNLGMTMKELASRAGVSECLISLIERGERCPSVKTAKKLAVAYGVNWTDFFPDKVRREA